MLMRLGRVLHSKKFQLVLLPRVQNQWGKMKRKQIWRKWRSKGVSEHLLTILSDWLGLKQQHASESHSLWFRSLSQGWEVAFLASTKVVLMLLIQGPHLKNHWLRPMVWDIWRECSDQWSGSLSAENPFVYNLSCPDGCSFPPASVVTSSQPSCNKPLPPHHLGGNAHQVFPLTPGHREDA